MRSSRPSATVILIAHEDRVELQHTLGSVLRASQATASKHHIEIVLFDEQGTYGNELQHSAGSLPVMHDPAGLMKLSGSYTFVVPRQTLVSQQWLDSAISGFATLPNAVILRPEIFVPWGDGTEPRILQQSQTVDPLYSLTAPLYSGTVAMTSNIFIEAVSSSMHDSQLSSTLSAGTLWLGQPAQTVSRTVVFGRHIPARQDTVQYGAPVFSFFKARNADVSPADRSTLSSSEKPSFKLPTARTKRYAKAALRRSGLLPLAKRAYSLYTASSDRPVDTPSTSLPDWLVQEWKHLHRLENRIFPGDYILQHKTIESGPLPHAHNMAYRYKTIAGKLRSDHYDYIFLAPWLIRGGADKYTIEYANTIAKLRPDYKILVITTLDRKSEWATRLDPSIDHCDFGTITGHMSDADKMLLLQVLLIQAGTKRLHIINSALAYDFVTAHSAFIRQQEIKIVATSFSQEIGKQGKLLGYSHTHMPEIYENTVLITSDNMAVLDMWRQDYGFNPDKLVRHRLPYATPPPQNSASQHSDHMRVLWASRITSEKLPQLVGDIGQLVRDDNITIDMYGTPEHNFDTSFLDNLPDNVRYKGPFDGFSTLPIKEYDAFLYTSSFDGMPNTLLEVGSAGLPIVSSAVGGIPELILDNLTGLLVPSTYEPSSYADALRALKQKPDLRQDMARNLRDKISSDYSQQQFIDSVAAMLVRLDA